VENIALKIIASLISGGINVVVYLGIFILAQLVVYQLFGISIVNKMMKLVSFASKVEIGG
jgi:hypothetical protein